MLSFMKRSFRLFALLLIAAMPSLAAAQELQITDIQVGEGQVAKNKYKISVHYTGWLLDGTKFDSSRDHDKPFTFRLGTGKVIPGWDEGLQGMREGGKRELVIPAHLAYGERGFPPAIPPNSTLRFEVEMVKVFGPAFTDVDNVQLKELLARGVPIVDIRNDVEWRKTGVIEGSNLITAFNAHGRFQQSFINDLVRNVARPNQEVILIGGSGNRTASLASALSTQIGFTKLFNVEKGIEQWIAEGNPVVQPEQ